VALDLSGRVLRFGLDGRVLWSTELVDPDEVPVRIDHSDTGAPTPRGSDDINTPASVVSPVLADVDCDGDDDVIASRMEGIFGVPSSRSYAVLDLADGTVIDQWTDQNGGHAVPLVADVDGDHCGEALVVSAAPGGQGQLHVWDVPQGSVKATGLMADPGVTGALADMDDQPGVELLTLGCQGPGSVCLVSTPIASMADVAWANYFNH